MHGRGVCRDCDNFARHHGAAARCGRCGRRQPLKKGYCRLCWCQARQDRSGSRWRHRRDLLPFVRQVRYHQLFFTGMPGPIDIFVIGGPRRFGVGAGSPVRARAQPPPVALRPASSWVQPPLFTGLRRHYRFGRADLRTSPAPDNPWLAWGLHIAGTMAQAHGWTAVIVQPLNRALVALLAGYTEPDLIRVSDYQGLLRAHGVSIARVTAVLAAMGIADDDRPAALDGWLAAQLDGVAPGIAAEALRWARALHQGAPRTRPLQDKTVRIYLAAARPALLDWSARYHHLRQVTAEDVRAHAGALRGQQAQTACTALRSLFSWARKNGVVFASPARQLRAGRHESPIVQPLTAEQITQAVQAATTPHARLFVALAAIHAARPAAIRALQLTDADLANHRLTIAGRTRPLDPLTRRIVQDWLTWRQQRWPHTANPHLLVNTTTAPGTGPVSHQWLKSLRGLPATLERLRIDRQLEEALTHNADPLHLATTFGIDTKTAVRYASAARQLLTRPHETGPASSPPTHRSSPGHTPGPPPGSR
jgi:hypothetical protein